MKLDNTRWLLAILTFGITTAAFAEEAGADVSPIHDDCNIFLKFPIGGSPKQLELLFGTPTTKSDISILTYTWRVEDNFITLQYDRGTLTSVEIDKKCVDIENHAACDLFRKYKSEWPSLTTVEANLGRPIESGNIAREEWTYKGVTEQAYIELQDGGVENIECIPVVLDDEFESSDRSQDKYGLETEAERNNEAGGEKEPLKEAVPDDPNYYDDSVDYDNY